MTPIDRITLVHAPGGHLTKFVHADGNITRPNVKFVDLLEQPIADLGSIAELLRQLEGRPDFAVVRGAPADPNRVTGVRRLLHADRKTGDAATIIEVSRRWIAFDIDDLPRPDWVDAADLVGCAAVATCHLPPEFKHASLVVQATASHAIKPGLRLRLWAWLSRPVSGPDLKRWMRTAPVDHAVFIANQTILTAAPVFLRGATDPLPRRLAVIPGRPAVEVPAPEQLPPSPVPPAPVRAPRTALRRAISPRNIDGLVRAVANAPPGRRNAVLFWASSRVAEDAEIDHIRAAAELQAAALAAGLDSRAARDTIKSAMRGRSSS